jgi:aspartate-semialdehyde dehydrogenase
VPVIASHSESVTLQTREPLEVDEARELLRGAPGLEVVDDPASHGYPTALAGAGRDEVFVGRLRRDPSHERGLCLWVVSDNLLKGAATNAVQLAELLHSRGLVRPRATA